MSGHIKNNSLCHRSANSHLQVLKAFQLLVISLLHPEVSSRLTLSPLSQGFKIDLNCKQLTADFVNQSVLQISSQDVESKRSDKTDFAEQLGAMNKSWQLLQGRVGEKVSWIACPDPDEDPESRLRLAGNHLTSGAAR